ncbi:MAG: MBL fold metallo-hydrolase, partial [Candidatus Thermoplasmatota archaeon]|nr:MBL fold metallo-hydrolase [Candidatus Thermoplasmatota archaeon]
MDGREVKAGADGCTPEDVGAPDKWRKKNFLGVHKKSFNTLNHAVAWKSGLMTRITFLGTGGGRFSTITQRRATGGILVEDGNRLHIDPGPGALVHLVAKGFDPQKLDGVLVSHCHPDHYNDAEILVEAMTSGGNKKRGLLLGSVSVMEGIDGFSAAVSPYHQEKVEI